MVVLAATELEVWEYVFSDGEGVLAEKPYRERLVAVLDAVDARPGIATGVVACGSGELGARRGRARYVRVGGRSFRVEYWVLLFIAGSSAWLALGPC